MSAEPSPQASQETYRQLTDVLREVFDNDGVVATPELTAAQVEGWNSINNVVLFLSIEDAFGVQFSSMEISGVKNVGELAAMIEKKRAR